MHKSMIVNPAPLLTAPLLTATVRLAAVRLRPCAAAATAARKLVRTTCGGFGFPTGLVEDAALVTGVLVTSSVRQAHSCIRLRVEVSTRAVVVLVEDDGTVLPLAVTDQAGGGGYGLDMVQRLTQRSGFLRTSTGRQAWALLGQHPGWDGNRLDDRVPALL
jgi:hypothetical protein